MLKLIVKNTILLTYIFYSIPGILGGFILILIGVIIQY